MPPFGNMLLLCAMQLCGYSSTIIFIDIYGSDSGGIREMLECTALTYATLNVLPPEMKTGLSYWRYVFLGLTLLCCLLWVISMMQKKFNRIYLSDVLPLGGLCATSVIVMLLKAIGFRDIAASNYDMFLNISTLFWSCFSITTSPFLEENLNDDYHPWYWFSRHNDPLMCGVKYRNAVLYSIIICITTMFTFNFLSARCAMSQSPGQFPGEYTEINVNHFIGRTYLMEGKKFTYFVYLATIIVLIVYGFLHLYTCLPARKAWNIPRHFEGIEDDESNLDTKHDGTGDNEVEADDGGTSNNDADDHGTKGDGSDKEGTDNDQSSFISDYNDPIYLYLNLNYDREKFGTIFIFGDWALLYLASVLMLVGYLIPSELAPVVLLILQISGFIATISLMSVFHTSDIGRYVLTHVSIHSVFLSMLSQHSKYTLSQWRNHLLILSQMSAKVLFILGISTEINSFSCTTISLMLCIPIVAEGLGVITLLRCLNKSEIIGKLLMEKVSFYLYAYSSVGFFVSVCIEIGHIILSELEFHDFLDPEICELFAEFCRIANGSIMFHVGSMLMYGLLNTWYFQYESNAGQQKQF